MSDGAWSMPCPTCGVKIRWQGEFAARPPCVRCQPAAAQRPRRAAPAADDVTEFLEECQEVLENINELPSKAVDFGESVHQKISDIAETVERLNQVTENQRTAVANMAAGVRRWLH